MADGDVSIGAPGGGDSGGTKLFGLPLPVVLAAGGGMLLLFLLTRKSGSDYNANMVPISTAVQLGDIQERQLQILGNVGKGFDDASKERQAYAQGQLEALSATQTALEDQLGALNQDLSGQISNLSADQKKALETQRADLLSQLAGVKEQQTSYFNSLMGHISERGSYNAQLTQSWGLTLNGLVQQILQQLAMQQNPTQPPGNPPGPPPNPATFGSWDEWYQGWRKAFGQAGGMFDVNQDNIVDIRDYGIGREIWKVS